MSEILTPKEGSSIESAPSAVSSAPSASADSNVSLEIADITNEVIDKLELPSEQPGENKPMSAGSSGSQGDDDAQGSQFQSALDKSLPQPKVMVTKIRTCLNKELKKLEKKAFGSLSRQVAQGKAHELNEVISQLRKLKAIMAHLAFATADYIKKLYVQLFRPKVVNN